MSKDTHVLNVIGSLYDAAIDESLWPHALEELTAITNSLVGTFWVLDSSDQPRLPTFVYINFDPSAIGDYLEHMAAIDPTVQYLVRNPNQSIVHDGLVITEREKDRHPYYDWHHRYSDTHFRVVGQTRPAPAVQAGIALHRTRKAGRFEPQDLELFSLLHRHLERALEIGCRLGSLGAIQQCTTELLDRNPAAILLLDEQKRIVYLNRSADGLKSHPDGIEISAAGITSLEKGGNDKLQDLIVRALSQVVSATASPGGVMRISRPSGKRPYVVLVAPISKRYPALSAIRPAVCILITDPDSQRPLPVSRLRASFGLTEAEAKLAVQLAAGEDLRSVGLRLGITYGTARIRLAEIFQKTETRRQGELVKVLLGTLAAV